MKWLRRIGVVLAALVAIVVMTALVLYVVGGRKFARTLDVDVHPIEIPDDSLSIAEGVRFARIFECVSCHGARLEGEVMIEDPVLGRLVAPHIAPGEGSVTTDFTTEDWVRAIRHGIGGDGRPLVIMPASYFVDIVSDRDLANIIAYLQQVEPVDHHPGKSSWRLAQVLLGAGVFPFEYDRIDHSKPPPRRPPALDTAATGEYLGGTCRVCHGKNLMGGEEFGGTPIAPGGLIEAYDEQSFVRLFRTGQAQNGRMIDSTRMPWHMLGAMTDDELHAVWRYIHSVPAATPDPTVPSNP
jgi:mono/diheme cytochrome c family protein